MELAAERGGSVAFSCLSTGIYGYPSAEAAEVACEVTREFLEGLEKGESGMPSQDGEESEERKTGSLERVIFCCFLAKDVAAYEHSLPRWFPPTSEERQNQQPEHPASTSPSTTHAEPSAHADPIAASTDLDKDEWVPVEKPQEVLEMSEEGEKIEGAEVSGSEGEKIEGAEVSGSDGEKVEVPPIGVGENSVKNTLLKDW